MSNQVNENLLERAAEMVDYWEGTAIAKVIEHDVKIKDLDSLRNHVSLAEAQSAQTEMEATDVL